MSFLNAWKDTTLKRVGGRRGYRKYKTGLVEVDCGHGGACKIGKVLGFHCPINDIAYDILIQCCSPCCTSKPLHYAGTGGCIWSGSGFQEHGGRASAKKWRQSIKVREEKTSLGQWLKKQHPIQGARFGTAVIGRTVWILWPSNDLAYFKGVITVYNATTGSHHMKYQDGDEQDLYLWGEAIYWP